jgi:hypothetical protein
MKDGESAVLPSQGGITAVTLVSSVAAPKTLADARPSIEQYLAQSGRRDVVVNLQKTLRDNAKIEYVGRFAPPAASGAASSIPSAAPAARASQNTSAQK